MKAKRLLLEVIARVGYRTAMKAAGEASRYGTYEPQEPEAILILRNKK